MKVKYNFVSSSLFSSLCHPKYGFPGPEKRKFGVILLLSFLSMLCGCTDYGLRKQGKAIP